MGFLLLPDPDEPLPLLPDPDEPLELLGELLPLCGCPECLEPPEEPDPEPEPEPLPEPEPEPEDGRLLELLLELLELDELLDDELDELLLDELLLEDFLDELEEELLELLGRQIPWQSSSTMKLKGLRCTLVEVSPSLSVHTTSFAPSGSHLTIPGHTISSPSNSQL